MTLPALTNWQNTRTRLHQAVQIVRAARLTGSDPLPNELEYSMFPTPFGVSSGPLNYGGELEFHYAKGQYIYQRDGDVIFTLSLDNHNQMSVFEAVFKAFREAGLDLDPTTKNIEHTEPLVLTIDDAVAYADVQWRMYKILSAVKGRMLGQQTPVVLWAHGFDLSTIWFAKGTDEHNDPHINMGFSPGTADISEPYVYFYAWPVPDGIQQVLPDSVQWHTGWSTPGGMIPYSKVAGDPQAEWTLIDTLTSVYQRVALLMQA